MAAGAHRGKGRRGVRSVTRERRERAQGRFDYFGRDAAPFRRAKPQGPEQLRDDFGSFRGEKRGNGGVGGRVVCFVVVLKGGFTDSTYPVALKQHAQRE